MADFLRVNAKAILAFLFTFVAFLAPNAAVVDDGLTLGEALAALGYSGIAGGFVWGVGPKVQREE